MSSKSDSIKKLRMQLEYLTEELNKTTEQIQLLEIRDEPKSKIIYADSDLGNEISELIRKQNTISHDIITVKKRIRKQSAKTILKVELLILPIVTVLLFFVITNSSIIPTEQDLPLKTLYSIENLRGDIASDYKYWNMVRGTPLIVNIENNSQVSNQKIQVVKNATMSFDIVNEDSSPSNSAVTSKPNFFKGWSGAIKTISKTNHYLPEIFNIVNSSNGAGDIVITLSTIAGDGYAGVTRTITNGNQILKVFITIYDSNKLTNEQLGSIVRHEFGHALGLSYTNNPKDLMYDTINAKNSYISECDVIALTKSYDDIVSPYDFCNN